MKTTQGVISRYSSIVLCCLTVWFGQLQMFAISLGDRVQANGTVNVRQTAAGTLLGTQSSGSQGKTIGGPTVATLNGTSYTWWNVDFDSGTDGWVADIGLIAIVPAAPTLNSPGSGSSPGTTISTLTPTMSWNAVNGATDYGLYIYDVTTSTLIYNHDSVGNVISLVLPSGTLTAGHSYRWNMRSHDSAGFSATYSGLLYFQTQSSPAPSISSVSPTSMAADNNLHSFKVYGSNFDTTSSHLLFTDPIGNPYTSASHPAYENRVSASEFDYQINNAGAAGTWTVKVQNPDSQTSGAVNFTVTNSTTTTNLALGIDVYSGSGNINWSAVSNAGIQFAYLKATESTYSPDSKFSANTNGAIGQHILVGAYHFATPLFSSPYYQPSYDHTDTSFQEASNFVNAAKAIVGLGFLPPSLDVEAQVVTWTLVGGVYEPSVWVDPLTGVSYDNSDNPLPSQLGMGASTLAQWINDWVSKVEQLTHTNAIPLVYCDRTYATALYPYINGTVKLWIADYSHSAGSPTPPAGWAWEFHQYSSTGSVGGISPADLDVFNGNLADLTAYVTGGNGGGGGGSAPVIGNPKLTGSTFTLSVPTQVGTNYVLEFKNFLSDAVWTPIQTNSGSGAQMTLTNTGVVGPSRFYRIRIQ